jgi:hypothetical protein
MIAKLVSLITLMSSVGLYILSASDPMDPLFFIISNNIAVEITRVLFLAALALAVFFPIIKQAQMQKVMGCVGGLFIIAGIIGFMTNGLSYLLYNYFRPLDFVILTEAGIVSTLLALEPQTQTADKPLFSLSMPHPFSKKLRSTAS